MENDRNREDAIKIVRVLLTGAIFLAICMLIIWLNVSIELQEKYVFMVVLGVLATIFTVVAIIIAKFVTPLMQCVEKEKAIGDFLERRYINILKYTRQLATAVEQNPDSVIITDTLGEILYVNSAFCCVTGYTAVEAIGKKPSIVKSGNTPQEIYEDLWSTIQSGKVWRGELQNRKKDGCLFWEDTSIAPILDGNGEISGFVSVRKDMTEQKMNAESLQNLTANLENLVQERTIKLNQAVTHAEAANKAKSDFLANISHELRTPLHAIKSFSSMILKKSTALMQDLEKIKDPKLLHYLSETLHLDQKSWESEIHFWLTRIIQNQERQLNLINDLLDLAKLESGKAKFQFRPSDIIEAVYGSVEELEPLFKEKCIKVTVTPRANHSKFCFDREQLKGVMKNLLGNSLKCTQSGGEISISLEDGFENNKETCVLKVQDNGCGIPEEELGIIFNKFTQSSHTSADSGGSGLGLSICREIIAAHKGTITANNHPDGGAIFTIILPKKLSSIQEKGPLTCVS